MILPCQALAIAGENALFVGRAEIVDDPAEKAKRWKDDWAAFYSDKNRGADYTLTVTQRGMTLALKGNTAQLIDTGNSYRAFWNWTTDRYPKSLFGVQLTVPKDLGETELTLIANSIGW